MNKLSFEKNCRENSQIAGQNSNRRAKVLVQLHRSNQYKDFRIHKILIVNTWQQSRIHGSNQGSITAIKLLHDSNQGSMAAIHIYIYSYCMAIYIYLLFVLHLNKVEYLVEKNDFQNHVLIVMIRMIRGKLSAEGTSSRSSKVFSVSRKSSRPSTGSGRRRRRRKR